MLSVEEANKIEISEEKTEKRVIVPPKSPKLPKVKRANLLIKKLKLRSKTDGSSVSPLPGSSSASPIRQTPEGGDGFAKNTLEDQEGASEGVEGTVEVQGKSSLESLKNMPPYGDLIVEPTGETPSGSKSVRRKDHLYKILVIGDLGAGKTSIIKRYVHRFFTQHYRATIGVDFALKVLNWDENTIVRLQLWDIAGQERYGNMTRVYYKEAVGAFVVFDVTRVSTFESVSKWKSDLDSKVQLSDGSSIPCVLLANKCDQTKESFLSNSNKMDEYCKENGFAAWFETSAKENINVDESARALVTKILQNDALLNIDANKDDDKFNINADKRNAHKSNCSC